MTLDLTALPIGSRLVTREGRRARLIANDLAGPCQFAIAVQRDGGSESVGSVDAAGRFWRDGGASKYDIVGRSAL